MLLTILFLAGTQLLQLFTTSSNLQALCFDRKSQFAGDLILNLFNLIPVSPLDGGRITAVLSPRIWFVGLPVLIAAFLYSPSPLLILIGILVLPQLKAAWNYDPQAPENQAYYGIKMEDRVYYGLFYLTLTGFLALISYDLHQSLRA